MVVDLSWITLSMLLQTGQIHPTGWEAQVIIWCAVGAIIASVATIFVLLRK